MGQKYKVSPLKSGLLAFSLSLTLSSALLLTQFLLKYKDDVFHKNIDTWTILKFCGITIIYLSPLIIPISVLVLGVVYYRKLFRVGTPSINDRIRKALAPITILSFLCFLWVSFIIPIASLHENAMIWDIQQKKPSRPLERVNRKLFKGYRMTSNLFELESLTDSSNARINLIKKDLIKSILGIADSTEINEVLQDSLAKAIGISKTDFVIEKIEYNEHGIDTAHKFRKRIHFYLEDGADGIENARYAILENRITEFKMLGFPLIITLVYFIGMFIGILNRHQKYLSVTLIGIYFTIFPCLYYLMVWFEKLVKEHKIDPFQGQLYYILVLTTITLLLYRYAKTNLNNNIDHSQSSNIDLVKDIKELVIKYTANNGLVKGGSLCFYGHWFGRPFDNCHKLETMTFDEMKNILILNFDDRETLTIVNPKNISDSLNQLTIQSADKIHFSFGKFPKDGNFYFEEIINQGHTLTGQSNYGNTSFKDLDLQKPALAFFWSMIKP